MQKRMKDKQAAAKSKNLNEPSAGITKLESSGSMQLNGTVVFFGRLRCYSVGKICFK